MEHTIIDETLLTGSEGATLYVDERTLAGTPAPMAASTVLKESQTSRPRVLRDNGGSFLNSHPVITGEVDSDGSDSDRSSLGLLPSNCLLEIETDLLREGNICLMKNADAGAAVSSSSVNGSKKNQFVDSQSSKEFTSDTNDFLTTVKKCPQAGETERGAGKYAPQALFQSVQEVDECMLSNSTASQRDAQAQQADKWDNTEAQKNADSGMGQGTFTGSLTSNGSGVVSGGLATRSSHSSGSDTRRQVTEVWNSRDTQKNGDSGTGQAMFAGSQVANVLGAVFDSLGIQIRRSAGGDKFAGEGFNLAQNEDDDGDQSVYQTKFDPEDLEKLENSFSDFTESSDEDDVADGGAEKQELRFDAGPKEDVPAQPTNLVSRMDGPFKVPLPLATPAKLPNRMCFGNQPGTLTTTPCKDPDLQAMFGDASQFHLSGSTTEWGPSIDFGSSTHISHLEKDSHLLDQENQKQFFTCDPAKPQQAQVPSFGALPADSGSRIPELFANDQHSFGDFPKGAASEVFANSEHPFGDVPLSQNRSIDLIHHNPFGDFAGEVTGVEFGDEDFMLDADAAAAMLAEDEKVFKNEHVDSNEALSLTQVSMRGADQTFMNMTIGTYMAAGSGELGSLTSNKRRPDIGMPVNSPPSDRYSGPLLSPDRIFRSPDGHTTQQITDEGHECFKNALFSLDNADSSVAFEEHPHKKFLDHGTQDTHLPSVLSSFPIADSQKHMQNDSARTSPKIGSSLFQAAVDTYPASCPKTSTKGDKTGELKSASINEHLQAMAAVALAQQPPSAVAVVQQPPSAVAVVQQPPSTVALVQQPPSAVAVVQQPPSAVAVVQQPPSTVAVAKQPPSTVALVQQAPSTVAVIQHPSKPPSTAATNHDHTLVQAEMSMSRLEDETHHSEHVTFSKIYNLIERSDTSVTNLGDLLLSEYQKMVSEKQSAKQSKKKTDMKPAEKVQEAEKSTDRPVTHLHEIAKTSTSATIMSQRIGESRIPVQVATVTGRNAPELEIQPSNVVTHSTETFDKKYAGINKDSTSVLPMSQSSKDYHQRIERQQLQISNAVNSQVHPSQSKGISDAGVTNTAVKQVYQERNSRLPTIGSQQVTAGATLKPSELNASHKSILPEKVDGQQRNQLKGPGTKILTPGAQQGHQMSLQSVSEGCTVDDTSLESVTINSTYSELARSAKPIVSHPKTLPMRPSFLQEKVNQLSVVRLQGMKPTLDNLHHVLNATANTTAQEDVSISQFHSLMHDSSRSLLENTDMQNKLYVSSTPYASHAPGRQKFGNITQITEKTILPLITPQVALDILELPEMVSMPEVCCVNLSLQTSFVVKNLLDKGVRCLITIGEVTFNGQRINSSNCPFEFKGQVILSPSSSQTVQVMFKPKSQGDYTANMEIFSQNMTKHQESRTYVLLLSGCSEEPALQISAVSEEIDFGEMLWGSTACRSINIKNVGRATIPLRCSIFRKESALCNFTFHPENVTDVSSISLTPRPATVATVYSLSLPGKKDGQKVLMETINIYCCTKESQNLSLRYMDKAEKFQAILTICVDVPIEDVLPLCKVKLHVAAGMYKLHVDQNTLPIITAPRKTGHGTVQIINSGNIAMPVNISLVPSRQEFTFSATNVCVPSGGSCPVHVTFTPQATREEQGDYIVSLMLQNNLSKSFVSVIGKIKTTKTNIRCSINAIDFGGVDLGHMQKLKAVFYVDNDDSVIVSVRNPGSAFKLLNEEGSYVDSFDVSARKGQKYDVFVQFSPSEVKGYSVDLTLQVLYANKYSIPVSGYGGRSQVQIEKVHQSNSRDLSLDIGRLLLEETVVRKFTVRNVGVRACYIKASLYDATRQVFASSQAAVIPEALVLSANESCEMFITMNPSKKEVDMCMYERAIVAILKLTWGDEVTRQNFILNPGHQSQKLVHDFDIPLSSTQKELVHLEMKDLRPPEDSYSVLKKGMSMTRIGLYGVPLDSHTPASTNTVARVESCVNRPASYQRPVLTPVDANIKPVDSNKKAWALNPTELYFTGEDLKVKDFIQVINLSTNEIQFSVEFDNKYITVAPSKGSVLPLNTASLDVYCNPTSISTKESTYLTMIRVKCLQQTQSVKVNIKGIGERPSPKPSPCLPAGRVSPWPIPTIRPTTAPVHTSKTTTLDADRGTGPRQQVGKFAEQPGHHPLEPMEDREGHSARIQGSETFTVASIEAGTRRDEVYVFTNVSTEPLIWKLAPFASPYVTLPDNPHSLFRVDYEVFQLSPLNGVLQPYETEKVHVQFCPQCQGSYNQAWCVYDTADSQGSFHRFTIYSKAFFSSQRGHGLHEQGSIPQGLSPTHFSKSPRGKHIQKSVNTPRLSAPTSASTSEAGKSHGPGSSLVHNSKVRQGMHLSGSSGMHRSNSTGVTPALITRSNSAVQRPPASSPGVSWVPVSQSKEASHHSSPTTSQTSSSGAVSSRATARGTVGSSSSTKDTGESVASDSLKSVTMQESTSSGSGSLSRGANGIQQTKLNLVHKVIKFPELVSGDSTMMKISVQNIGDDDSQVEVECAPRPPFMIKHHSFNVRKSKMVKFPVIFKPKHVAKFEDAVVFRDSRTGNTVTATLLAECVNTRADTTNQAVFSQR
ncbi:hypothetical protein BsWGS_16413 [Bradybaena similaris]